MLSTALKAVLHLKDANSTSLTDDQIAKVTAAIEGAPRVSHVEYLGRVLQGRPAYKIRAADTVDGVIDGEYSIGRVLQVMARTTKEFRADIAAGRAKFDALVESVRQESIKSAAENAEKNAERIENLRRLKKAYISPKHLAWICNRLASGQYVNDDALDDWAYYEREIVRGRPFPMKLSLYLDGFVD